ncbi:Ras-like protein family member 12 [Platysternon megacephalum]|uniref:Ras-like protein family member 12 n=1 Tax=Platysternon megacephalum TaxID=55544 RepID=A0A4D9EY63_9SAUR|nr:Ras-like protein family member 12 [Platysternon megacephalum]
MKGKSWGGGKPQFIIPRDALPGVLHPHRPWDSLSQPHQCKQLQLVPQIHGEGLGFILHLLHSLKAVARWQPAGSQCAPLLSHLWGCTNVGSSGNLPENVHLRQVPRVLEPSQSPTMQQLPPLNLTRVQSSRGPTLGTADFDKEMRCIWRTLR